MKWNKIRIPDKSYDSNRGLIRKDRGSYRIKIDKINKGRLDIKCQNQKNSKNY